MEYGGTASTRRRCVRTVAFVGVPEAEKDWAVLLRLAGILERYTPLVEYCAGGRFYLDFTGQERLWSHPLEAVDHLRACLRRQGFRPEIGVGENKFLARAAGRLAGTGGCFWILSQGRQEALSGLPVEYWPELDGRMVRQLRALGIARVGDLNLVAPFWIRSVWGKHGDMMMEQARGRDLRPVVRRLPLPVGEQSAATGSLFPPGSRGEKLAVLGPILDGLRRRYGKRAARLWRRK
ncbi:MAG TPA: hypothetical protein PK636_07420 [bacterium]|nr:hypothetical protein [bacterium]HPJ72496.1 hypothetical protein [bacterium]HPQ66192.1 hypothetical protein [bacterium]